MPSVVQVLWRRVYSRPCALRHSCRQIRRRLGGELFSANQGVANQSLDGPFLRALADGSLPSIAFQRYISQDNLYLSKYARAMSALAASSTDDAEFVWLTDTSFGYLHEHNASASYRTETDFERGAGSVTVAYTSLFLSAAATGNRLLALAAAVLCQRLYDYIFSTLLAEGAAFQGNPYKAFIEQYAAPGNHEQTEQLELFLNREAASGLAHGRAERAQFYYRTALIYEAEFFAQGLEEVGGVHLPRAL